MPLPSGRPWPAADPMRQPSESPQVIAQIMALTAGEFTASLTALFGALDAPEWPLVRHAVGSGEVQIRFEPLASVRLGGLLELPRARVTLSFEGVGEADRQAFMRRFDVAFQRGGG